MEHTYGPSDLSVLMSTHAGERAEYLRRSLQSVFGQTMPAAECVLVLDGPVGEDQHDVIRSFADRPATRLKILQLPECRFMANALNAALPLVSGRLVARMDSDDIALPHRFEKQLDAFNADPSLDVLCGWSAEFEGDQSDFPHFIKTTPPDHESIARMLKWRCGITHPSIILRKVMLERVGGYRDCFGDLADYDLYVRLLLAGARFAAVQEPLVLFRVSHEQRIRRGGWRYAWRELAFRRFCAQAGFLSPVLFAATTPVTMGFRLAPPRLKKFLYGFVRTKPAGDVTSDLVPTPSRSARHD